VLLKLVEQIGYRGGALRRNECGDWRIVGKFGDTSAVPGIPRRGMEKIKGFQIYFRSAREFEEPTSSQACTWAKKALSFCRISQDGDEEGMLFLNRPPTQIKAEVIRDKLVIPKKREVNQEDDCDGKASAPAMRMRVQTKNKPAPDDKPVHISSPKPNPPFSPHLSST
jgi:hypothetical protein